MDYNERKLVLLNDIRREQNENIYRMQRREKILYPDHNLSYKNNMKDFNYYNGYEDSYNQNAYNKYSKKIIKYQNKNSFIIRLCIAVFIFLIFLYIKENNIEIYAYDSYDFQNYIAKDLDLKSFAFMEQFSYTLED